jgi:hypothetical protein
VRWRRRPRDEEAPWTWPYRGTVAWLTPEQGGRTSGPPRPGPDRDFYATTAFVPPHTLRTGQASFVLRGFSPDVMTSPAEARWLVPGVGDFQTIESGAVVVVTEGARTVAHFHVDQVDDDPSSS